jgi:hypothetical protein
MKRILLLALALGACTPSVDALTFPVSVTPDWGRYETPEQWDRSYAEIPKSEFVRVPKYNLRVLTMKASDMEKTMTRAQAVPLLTAKLFYSTRYCGTYDLDKGEYTGGHCAIDLKLPFGQPVYALSDGFVQIIKDDDIYGNNVKITFRNQGKLYTARYAHLDTVAPLGKALKAGQLVGTVGLTGNTSDPHLHLDIEDSKHKPVNPMIFFPSLR